MSSTIAPSRQANFEIDTRECNLERLATESFDVCIIGGGITGAGVALHAAARGLSVALIEKGDFASGSSSRSSRLVHGGLRYLQNGDVRMCRACVRDRDRLLRSSPHLVRPMPFLYLLMGQHRAGTVGLGLTAYDFLAGTQGIGRHRRQTQDSARRIAPLLRVDRLEAAWTYWDATTDDSRLVLDVLLRAHSFGAVVANHVRGEGFETSTGPMHAVRAIDEVGHRQLTIRARSLVDASGVWTGTLDGTDRPPRLRPSKGVHLVVPAARLPLLSACVFPAPDGREVFAAPDGPTTIFGTTDTEYDGPLDAPFVDGADVEYLLGAVNGAFRADLQPDAVIAAWAGLRPLIDDGRSSVERTRHSRVTVSSSRVVTVTGGKLTVFLSMAEQATDAVCELLGERRASHVPFGDGELGGPDPYARVRAEGLGLDEHQVDLLVARYGERAVDVLKLWADEPHLTRSSADATDTLGIEAVWAVRHEMAVHLEDVISRRLRLATGELDAGLGTRIPSVVARERGWSREETARQIDACARSIAHERGPSLRPPRPDPGGRGSGAEPPHPGSGESPG